MNMPDQKYWKKRFEAIAQQTHYHADKVGKELRTAYDLAVRELQKEIDAFYLRWGREQGLSYHEAIKDLRGEDFRVWKRSIKQYLKLIEQTGDEQLLRELNGLALRSRITRMEELITRIQMITHQAAVSQESLMTQHLSSTYQENVYRTIFAIHTGTTIGTAFSVIDERAIDFILQYPWSGKNYSQRIWKNRAKLAHVLQEKLVQGFIQGQSNQKMARNLAVSMDAAYKNALTLIRTETTFVANMAATAGYKKSGVVEYEFLATLDQRTSELCQEHDGKVYKVADAKSGVNLPPLHVKCRSTTVPYFGKKTGERIALDGEGNRIYVPADITYAEWKEQFIKS
ncbi:hypothetical protein BP422_13125 [Brevibacillus formosus]|uniref:Phage head morphogenesis domain-containing protein n=1 Tax=Brevibacillus formosus TaxID=54913 RepID=A0A220MH55_9BACL|nr:minor capsid protein [Brevibacillus formosus]ASJ54416.1 hypothetical protein BP422_13125 [Brevibacillus formosus]